MSVEITPAMVERFKLNYDPANELEQPDIPAGLAAVLAMPEVRRAVVADMPVREVMAVIEAAEGEPEAWGSR